MVVLNESERGMAEGNERRSLCFLQAVLQIGNEGYEANKGPVISSKVGRLMA